jgi:hypothetical protein
MPGMANIYYAPKEFIHSVKAFVKADAIDDQPGMLENGLRAISTPFSFLHSLGTIAWYVVQGGIYAKLISESLTKTLFPLSASLTGVGVFMCLIEGTIETYGLARAIKFNSTYNSDGADTVKKIEKLYQDFLTVSPASRQKIENFVEYTYKELTPAGRQAKIQELVNTILDRKLNQLVRHVYPRMAEELKRTIPAIIRDLKSADSSTKSAALKKAEETFKEIKTQSNKQILIHAVGIAAVLVTLAGLILSCIGCPFLVPFLVLAGGATLSLGRYFLHEGLMDSKGWEFKLENCIPMSNYNRPTTHLDREIFARNGIRV